MHGTLPEVIIEGKVPKFGSAGIVSGFSVLKFIAEMNKIVVSSYSLHKCAMYIRLGLESGGLNTSRHPIDAGDYGPFLINKGFGIVNPVDYNPNLGDIAVFNKTLQHPYGHIQAYNGTQWLSDYKQDYFIPYKSQLTILRWGK